MNKDRKKCFYSRPSIPPTPTLYMNLLIFQNKTGTNLKSPQKRKDKKRREMEAQGLEGKNNEFRLNNERMKETGQKTLL